MVLLCMSLAVAAQPSGAAPKAAAAPAPVAAAPVAAVDTLQMLQRAVAKDSTRFDDLYRLGILYLDKDQANEASVVLMKAHKLRPKDHRVLVNLGAAEDAGGSPLRAQRYYEEALKLAPDDSVASCRLASSLYAQNLYAPAVDVLRKIIKERPTAYCAYFTMGVAFADAGIYRDAIRMWQKVVELAPLSPEAISARESMEVLEKIVQQ
jgi:tetratricopeptide (TPR) repeat protein